MDVTPALPKDHHIIQSYGAGRFVVQGQNIERNMLIWAGGYQAIDGVQLPTIDISDVVNPLPELVIVGTGVNLTPIPQELKQSLKSQNLSFELMDTGAACRTYNVLISEDRRVCALLTLV